MSTLIINDFASVRSSAKNETGYSLTDTYEFILSGDIRARDPAIYLRFAEATPFLKALAMSCARALTVSRPPNLDRW